ncbi:peptidase C15 [uncultured Methylobacterium sp.]|uniref:pyroglutamyl-peptidase I family protein n=1 Tax=uncultured Methylobacterium sp. TaxID=157278 RepID=UPI0035CA60E8
MSGHLLVTGFGPFPRVPVNPSEIVARRLAAHPRLRRLLGDPPRLLVLRTAYDAIEESLVPALAQGPAAILMFGVATRARRVRVEMRAINRASRLFPDACGRVATRLSLEADGPSQRRSTVSIKVLTRLRGRDASCSLSRDAGRYLCNASYYRALREDCPVLFVHIPPLSQNSIRMTRLIEGAVEVADELMRETRRSACRKTRR